MTEFVSRKQWGSQYGTAGHIIGPVNKAVCHHTPGQDGMGDYTRALAEVRRIEKNHVEGNGWSAIGYTWLVSGQYAFEGRGFGRSGAHAPGANSSSVGIAFLLDARDRQPTPIEWHTAAEVVRAGINGGWITSVWGAYGHRDFVATLCPGELIYGSLQALLDAFNNPLPSSTPSPILPEIKETIVVRIPERTDWVAVGVDGNLYHKIYRMYPPTTDNAWIPPNPAWGMLGSPPGGVLGTPSVDWAGDWLLITAVSKANNLVYVKRHHPAHNWIDWAPIPDVQALDVATTTRYIEV